ARFPARAAVLGRERAYGADRDPHLRGVGGVGNDRVTDEAAGTRRPARLLAAGVVAERRDVGPRLAPVLAPEQPGRLDAGIDRPVRRGHVPDRGDLGAVVA